MSVLIDSSVWIEYFRNGNNYEKVDFLIDENLLVINDLVLTELVPFLKLRKQHNLVDLLYEINRLEMNIQWSQLIELQQVCLMNGLNGVGIPDLVIVQNVMQHGGKIYSMDKHFSRMTGFFDFDLF